MVEFLIYVLKWLAGILVTIIMSYGMDRIFLKGKAWLAMVVTTRKMKKYALGHLLADFIQQCKEQEDKLNPPVKTRIVSAYTLPYTDGDGKKLTFYIEIPPGDPFDLPKEPSVEWLDEEIYSHREQDDQGGVTATITSTTKQITKPKQEKKNYFTVGKSRIGNGSVIKGG